MFTLFGNFDPQSDSSQYDVPQTTAINLKGSKFGVGDEIVVQPIRTLEAEENGKRKVILLTWAVPKESFERPSDDIRNFQCHACAPLIGVAVFVRDGATWKVESSRTAVTVAGGFGDPPRQFRVVRIGPHSIGIEMNIEDSSGGERSIFKVIMVPWNGKVNVALRYVASDSNRDNCGTDADDLPCYSNRRHLVFLKGAGRSYYQIRLTLSGKDLTQTEPYRPKAVKGWQRFAFADGHYALKESVGDRTSVEQSIAAFK